MNSFQLETMTNPETYNSYNRPQGIEGEPVYEIPRAPKLRAQQAPMECEPLSLPLSKDEFMSHQSRSCPATDINILNNNLILQSLSQQLSQSMQQQHLSEYDMSQQLSFQLLQLSQQLQSHSLNTCYNSVAFHEEDYHTQDSSFGASYNRPLPKQDPVYTEEDRQMFASSPV
jgi:hypothetical protein